MTERYLAGVVLLAAMVVAVLACGMVLWHRAPRRKDRRRVAREDRDWRDEQQQLDEPGPSGD